MKTRTLIIGALATLATVAAPMAASAQHWRGDRDRDGRYERWERREDRRDYRRNHRYDRYYGPPPRYAHGPRRYYRGATIPHHYRSHWYVRDYDRYGYGPPPRGYGYYRTDTGDIVLAALATGVIISLLN